MNLQVNGVLNQPSGSVGTVAVIGPDHTVHVLVPTAPGGHFTFSVPPSAPPDSILYGFPGAAFDPAQVAAQLLNPAGTIYQAPLFVGQGPGALTYVNVASTCVVAAVQQDPALAPEVAAAQLKAQLFGASIAKFTPGFTTEFLANRPDPRVFFEPVFMAAATQAGGIFSWVQSVAVPGMASPPQRAPFRAPRRSGPRRAEARARGPETNDTVPVNATGRPASSVPSIPEELPPEVDGDTAPANATGRPASSVPSIPEELPPEVEPAEDWATNNPMWRQNLRWSGIDDDDTDEDWTDLADSMSDLAATTDGIKASVTNPAFSTSLGTLGSWGVVLAHGVVSAIGGQLFNLVGSWVLGAISDTPNPTTVALAAISKQLNTIQGNVIVIGDLLSDIENQLAQMQVNLLGQGIQAQLSTIQTNLQAIQGYATAPAATDAAAIQATVASILDTNNGVVYALQQIHGTVMGSLLATSLPKALHGVLRPTVQGVPQSFLSNSNCFLAVQAVFNYLALIQTQGAQLVMQAHNYNQNSTVFAMSDPPPTGPQAVTAFDQALSTPLTLSPRAVDAFNATLIGGAGLGGMPPNLVQQRDLFRATFWNDFRVAAGYSGPLPADMATGLIPSVAGQSFEVFCQVDSQLLVLGHLSGKLRKWTAGTDVLTLNSDLIGTPWTLPSQLQWRYPMGAEIQAMIAPTSGLARYDSNKFLLFTDQGFTTDAADYGPAFSFFAVFLGDNGNFGDAWRGQKRVPWFDFSAPLFPCNPCDVNGTVIQPTQYTAQSTPWSEKKDYHFAGTFPLGFATSGTTFFYSSRGENIYQPGDPSTAWSGLPWLQISGGFVVADSIGYRPAGSYAQSCTDIKITLTGSAQTNDGGAVSFAFDLTPHACIALQNNNGVLEVTNPFALTAPSDRTAFLPPGPYQSSCYNLKVTLCCTAQTADGSGTPATYDLTNAPIMCGPLANINGVIIPESEVPPSPSPGVPNPWHLGQGPWSG